MADDQQERPLGLICGQSRPAPPALARVPPGAMEGAAMTPCRGPVAFAKTPFGTLLVFLWFALLGCGSGGTPELVSDVSSLTVAQESASIHESKWSDSSDGDIPVLKHADCGPQVTRRGNALVVAPSGGDDTAALQCAIDHVATGTVRLNAGTFHLGQIIAGDFKGRIVGAGSEKTTLENRGQLAVAPTDWYLAPNSPSNPWPTLLGFTDGDFKLSDFAISIRGEEATTGWSAFGISTTTLAHAISITGGKAAATIERIRVQGEPAPAEFVGLNLLNAIDAEGIGGSDPKPLSLRLEVRDCSFTQLVSGIPVSNVRDADVTITESHFSTLLAGELVDFENSRYRFVANEASTVWATIDLYDVALGPSSVLGFNKTSILIAGNRIAGGPIILEGTFNADMHCALVGNKFANTGGLDVYLGSGIHDCLVVGTPNVIDDGTNNHIVP